MVLHAVAPTRREVGECILQSGCNYSSMHLSAVLNHTLSRARKKAAIFFLHVSKSGGTALCNLAAKAGCTTTVSNCFPGGALHGEFDWLGVAFAGHRPRWGEAPTKLSCARRVEMLERAATANMSSGSAPRGRFFFANERWLDDADLGCEQWLTVVTIRDPVSRVRSHLGMLLMISARTASRNESTGDVYFDRWFRQLDCRYREAAPGLEARYSQVMASSCVQVPRWARAVETRHLDLEGVLWSADVGQLLAAHGTWVDNLLTRSLAGEVAALVRLPRVLTQAHHQQAMRSLRRHVHVHKTDLPTMHMHMC